LDTTFICDDAQRHAFMPGSFDLIMSRFGVMFFDDFAAAFRNLRRAARPHGRLRFIAWRGAEENPFMTAAENAARALLPHLPVRRPDEPGQFAFGSQGRIRAVLEDSAWAVVGIEALDVPCTFPASALTGYLTRMGPLGRVLQHVDEGMRRKLIEAVRPAFDPYVHGDLVCFNAACWDVSARAHADVSGRAASLPDSSRAGG
jgi:SAM-dependent methyltransferase